jgi:hypothetical protein
MGTQNDKMKADFYFDTPSIDLFTCFHQFAPKSLGTPLPVLRFLPGQHFQAML